MAKPMSRAEHMRWCKERAREYAVRGDKTNCVASMCSDLSKHPETMPMQQMAFILGICCGETPADLIRYVDGFAE